MAGGAQGGRPAQNQGVGTQGAPQVTPQAQQFQQALQKMQQNMAGMPSQVPGANMAAPGGGSIGMMPGETGRGGPMQSFNPGGGMASAAVMPQAPQMSQPMPMAPISVGSSQPMPQMDQAQLQQIQAMANNTAYQQALLAAQQATMGGGNVSPTPMPMPRPRPMPQTTNNTGSYQSRPMPQDPRMQQNPRMTPRVSDMMPRREQMARPQIQGNPNAMPIQRGQGRVR